MINLLLDGLMCSIVGYFYSSLIFWLALHARQNTAPVLRYYTLNRPISIISSDVTLKQILSLSFHLIKQTEEDTM